MMLSTLTFNGYTVARLSLDLAEKYATDICEALDQIPGVDPHSKEQLLQEKNGDRILHRKWDHSFIV